MDPSGLSDFRIAAHLGCLSILVSTFACVLDRPSGDLQLD